MTSSSHLPSRLNGRFYSSQEVLQLFSRQYTSEMNVGSGAEDLTSSCGSAIDQSCDLESMPFLPSTSLFPH